MRHAPGTLQDFLVGELQGNPDKEYLIKAVGGVAAATKDISYHMSRVGVSAHRGYSESKNVHDEPQAKLDLLCNDICKDHLGATGVVAAYASEEEETVVELGNPDGQLVGATDPLDGSSGANSNTNVGTFFSFYKKLPDIPVGDERQYHQAGRDQALAAIADFGTATELVITWGNGVHKFTLDPDSGDFYLSEKGVMIPDACPYYRFNEAYADLISDDDQKRLAIIKERAGKLRWVGALAHDFYCNLLEGGILFSPSILKAGSTERVPKLRRVYEVQPVAFIAEQAGGLAISDGVNTLDIVPRALHEKAPLIVGNRDIIESL